MAQADNRQRTLGEAHLIQRHLELVVNSLGRDQGSGVNSSIKLSAQCSMRSNGQNTAFNLDTEDYLSPRNEIPKISCT